VAALPLYLSRSSQMLQTTVDANSALAIMLAMTLQVLSAPTWPPVNSDYVLYLA
jgi:hypothetical protein